MVRNMKLAYKIVLYLFPFYLKMTRKIYSAFHSNNFIAIFLQQRSMLSVTVGGLRAINKRLNLC